MDAKGIGFAIVVTALAIVSSAKAQQAAPAVGDDQFHELRVTQFEAASLRNGRQTYLGDCATCHSADQRGTSRGSDLSRSILLIDDKTGDLLRQLLRAPHGAEAARISYANLSDAQIKDLSNFLRAGNVVINRRSYIQPSILVGDAAAGQRYFAGAGRCSTCHSPSGDMAKIGSKYEPPILQWYILSPPRVPPAPARPPGSGPPPPPPTTGPVLITKNQMRATVHVSGKPAVTGQLVRATYWEVVIADLNTGERQTFTRVDGKPRVTLVDPLVGHEIVRRTISDADMHNVTAYLASLK